MAGLVRVPVIVSVRRARGGDDNGAQLGMVPADLLVVAVVVLGPVQAVKGSNCPTKPPVNWKILPHRRPYFVEGIARDPRPDGVRVVGRPVCFQGGGGRGW